MAEDPDGSQPLKDLARSLGRGYRRFSTGLLVWTVVVVAVLALLLVLAGR